MYTKINLKNSIKWINIFVFLSRSKGSCKILRKMVKNKLLMIRIKFHYSSTI
ncbi:hypothetical protein TTHERM_00635680 (macronuclear) [Tetrahymena thermophila SB210]|uniref:Uncharacterized protein n=1 Tax=Tetrahymena thermophila (strain SB210) TaxID=312017 RepID=Q22WY3_TETTS|nr:hypothetical protein TTHERM_00635680 [Tetrahymena thermophila SB210]EAR89863.1 hypothetical protein TTHERM_00635680 [Tetrahymena thermophila SB210]|eukprot:XP_001010108.1 hypothetical protein TTHERM_00635680 [Tetrahymena thermophila SB210]